MLTATVTPYFLPVLLAFLIGVATFFIILVKGASGEKIVLSLVYLAVPALLMAVFTLGYLFGPDCVFCTQGGRLRGVVEYLIGVLVFGSICMALVRWAGRADN